MTSIDVPRNSSQKVSASFGINTRAVTPTTFYTCPAGKKASIRGTAECDSTGAAGIVNLKISSLILATWLVVGGFGNQNIPSELKLKVKFNLDLQLNAGDTLSYDQDSGTNASMNLNVLVEESSA